jgi:hypothetical protein
VTNPLLDTTGQLGGNAADAVRTLHVELGRDYTEIRSAEIRLAEAVLSAHATTASGRERLHDIQRQIIEVINNPVSALGTPAGERQFLLFLRSRIADIQQIVDEGALTDEDHAKLTRALGSGYLISAPEADGTPRPRSDMSVAGQPLAPVSGLASALPSALGSLPQAAQGAAGAGVQGASGLAGAAQPLTGLASQLTGHAGEPETSQHDAARESKPKDGSDAEGVEPEDDRGDGTGDARERTIPPPSGDEPEPQTGGPAPTRPAASSQ